MSEPKLYNWVRAIKKISLASAIYTSVVMLFSITLFFMAENTEQKDSPTGLIFGLGVSILATLFVQKVSIKRLIAKFKTNFSFEVLLASWCVLLILLHLQCQLLTLMVFQYQLSTALAAGIFIFALLVVGKTWPRLTAIQSLLNSD